ncbi:MAG TPA: histidine-type phosphatase [Acidobacteriaceae bacterium]|jgi:4-phytase/acid phosphatase|nr:histidine-type phosphatase [Acidobacteriaceae bacterium]
MAATATPGPDNERLRMVIILSRHGVRPPTWTQARLDSYSALPWPKWDVPPGDLTAHGYGLMKLLGGFDRAALADKGFLAAQGCADAAGTYLWADTDQRTMESGKALAEGLFPGCAPAVHSLAEGESDPLFHSAIDVAKLPDMKPVAARIAARVKEQSTPQQRTLIDQMRHLLMGCDLHVACKPARAIQELPSDASTRVVAGKGDHLIDIDGPLTPAASFAEDFLLEYAEGMPMEQVGWGKVDEPQLRRFLTLHSEYFGLVHRTPELAGVEASNLLDHILRTIDQGVSGKPVAGAIGPPGEKVVVLVGHDTNLAGIASLLHLSWTADGRADDTPPGAELQFLIYESPKGRASVRLTYQVQTLSQMRESSALTSQSPPVEVEVPVPSCTPAGGRCEWEQFRHLAASAINPGFVTDSAR